MAHVVVSIAGRTYRMACDDGEEEQLRGLAALVEGKILAMREDFGDIGEQRSIVMAAIAIADEAKAARDKLAALEEEVAALRAESAAAKTAATALEDRAAGAIEKAADRLERLAAALQDAAPDDASAQESL